MTEPIYSVRQLAYELPYPESGKASDVVHNDERTKVVLFAFAAGGGLPEHPAPMPATILIIEGEATLTVGAESVAGRPGTWIAMDSKTLHSVQAATPTRMLLTLSKE